MARIRTIKPEFWTSGQVMECSMTARLMFIGLWNFCDDHGRMPLRPRQIKASIFPSDDIPATDILGMIQELSRNGLIETYTVDEQDYLRITGWHHQRIDKRQDPKYPGPDQDNSTNIPGLFPPEGKGKERKGKDQKTRDHSRNDPEPTRPDDPKPDLIQQTHDAICDIAGADPVRSPSWMQTGVTRSWLAEGIPPETIIAAVRDVMTRRPDAPRNPSYFTPAVREAHAGGGPKPDPLEIPDFLRRASNDEAQQRGRLRLFVKTGDWLSDWGDKPTREQAEAMLEKPPSGQGKVSP